MLSFYMCHIIRPIWYTSHFTAHERYLAWVLRTQSNTCGTHVTDFLQELEKKGDGVEEEKSDDEKPKAKKNAEGEEEEDLEEEVEEEEVEEVRPGK